MSDSRVQNYFVLGLMATADLVAGLVCAGIGITQDVQAAAVVGTVLTISGAGMWAFLVWARSRPESL